MGVVHLNTNEGIKIRVGGPFNLGTDIIAGKYQDRSCLSIRKNSLHLFLKLQKKTPENIIDLLFKDQVMKYLESKSSIQCTLSSHNLLSILQMYIHTPVFILCDNNAYFTSNIDLQNHFMSVYVDQLFWRILILQYAQYSFFPIPYITQFHIDMHHLNIHTQCVCI